MNFSDSEEPENTESLSLLHSIECFILLMAVLCGGPLNIVTLCKLARAIRKTKNCSQIVLLRLNLNIADLIMLFVYVPIHISWIQSYQWNAGDLACRGFKYISVFCFYLNSFIITCIALDRFIGMASISSFQNAKNAKQRAVKMLFVAWSLAFIVSIPQLFIFQSFSPYPNFEQCVPIFLVIYYTTNHIQTHNFTEIEKQVAFEKLNRTKDWENIYNIYHLLFIFWIPIFIIIVCYFFVLLLMKTLVSGHKNRDRQMAKECSFTSAIELSTSDRNGAASSEIKRLTLYENGSLNDVLDSQETEKLTDCECEEHNKITTPETLPTSTTRNSKPLFSINLKVKTESLKQVVALNLKNGTKEVQLGNLAMKRMRLARKRTKKQALFIIVTYIILWSPYNVLAIIQSLSSNNLWIQWFLSNVPLFFLNSIIVINPLINAIIYGIFDPK
uniref:G_PROTEIN_RECEP_F1_2 domain-containing protein n=1 Tax=Rhabditophanes sp. KR3021 TaxID=114890 RepID=A0AC35UIF4_9BILA